jgi:very-short-patch-repair endonuclease
MSHLLNWLIVAAVLFAIVIVIAALVIKARGSALDGEWPFYAKRPLSAPEQVLYFRLVKALPEHIVLAQVQLSRFLGVKKGNNSQSWLNRINRMSADFVVCQKDATVLAVIELDDASHRGERRVAADAKKDKSLASAGIRLVRWQVRSLPDEAAIRGSVAA